MADDVVAEYGALFLASRLKRLAERMQADVQQIAEGVGLPIQPSQYPLLAALDRHGAMPLGRIAELVGLSQPAVTRAIGKLAALGLVARDRGAGDQRQRAVSLSAAGREAMARSKRDVWPRVEAAALELLAAAPDAPLLDQVAAIETALGERSLSARAAAGPASGIAIREFSDELAPDFHDINATWIAQMFRLETTDREVLENPRERIVDPGGVILFADVADLGVVGTCALQKTGERRFELTKMGVRESARGRGVGEVLLHAMLRRARQMRVETLYLLTNARCDSAIRLYERAGFVHDAAIMRDFGARYERCNVAMLYAPNAMARR